MSDRHAWDDDDERGIKKRCVNCGTKKITLRSAGGDDPVTRYLVSGVGWTQERPPCEFPKPKKDPDPQAPLFPEED